MVITMQSLNKPGAPHAAGRNAHGKDRRPAGRRRLTALLLAASMLLTACGGTAQSAAAETPQPQATVEPAEPAAAGSRTTGGVDKRETVYAAARADGTVTETTVEAVLRAGDGDTIDDYSTLRDIINTEGDEEYTAGGDGTLVWQNHGSDITYEGTTQAALPVSVRVSYYLDGQQITPEALAGRSGTVRIRFDYGNTAQAAVEVDGQALTVAVPFTAMTALVLEDERFTNVEAENGTVLAMDGMTAVVGVAMPGLAGSPCLADYEPLAEVELPSYFEVTADVTDFALDFTATIVTPGLLDDADLTGLEDADELADAMDELQQAAGELGDGAGALADGILTLYEGFGQYAEGVKSLNTGAEALADGLTQLYDNSAALMQGAEALRDGLSTLSGALGQVKLDGGSSLDTAAVTAAMTALAADAAAVGASLETLTVFSGQVSAYLAQVETAKSALSDVQADANTLNGAARERAKNLLEAELEKSDYSGLTAEQKSALLASLDGIDLSSEAAGIDTALATAQTALAGIGTPPVPDAAMMQSLAAAVGDMQTQLQTLAAFAQGLSGLGDSLGKLSPMLSQLQAGMGKLASGSAQLTSGLDSYIKAVETISHGADTLAEGSAQLDDATAALNGGFAELYDGAAAMRDGVQEFSGDGLDDLTELGGEGLQTVARRLRAVQQAGQGYQNFSGLADGQTGSVRFIIETEGIG